MKLKELLTKAKDVLDKFEDDRDERRVKQIQKYKKKTELEKAKAKYLAEKSKSDKYSKWDLEV